MSAMKPKRKGINSKLLEEGYKKTAKLGQKIEEELKFASTEADRLLSDY